MWSKITLVASALFAMVGLAVSKETATNVVLASLAGILIILLLSEDWIENVVKFIDGKIGEKKEGNGESSTTSSESNP